MAGPMAGQSLSSSENNINDTKNLALEGKNTTDNVLKMHIMLFYSLTNLSASS